MRLSFSFRLVTVCLAVLLLPTSGSALGGGGGSAALAAGAGPVEPARSPSTPLSALWDATTHNSGTSYTSSSAYGSLYANISNQAADDFQVAPNAIWHIATITVIGQYVDGGTNSMNSALVQIYADAGNLPGQLLFSQTFGSGSIGGLSTGTLVFNISPPYVVGPGHYWLSVRAERPLTHGDLSQWVWNESTQQQLAESAWQQPLDGYGTGCKTWAPRYTVCKRPSKDALDLVFKIDGSLIPVSARLFLPIVRR